MAEPLVDVATVTWTERNVTYVVLTKLVDSLLASIVATNISSCPCSIKKGLFLLPLVPLFFGSGVILVGLSYLRELLGFFCYGCLLRLERRLLFGVGDNGMVNKCFLRSTR